MYQKKLRGNFTWYALIIGIVSYIILLNLTKAGIIALIMTAVVVFGFKIIYNKFFSKNRVQQAEEYKKVAMPPALAKKKNAEEMFQKYCSSDEVYNVSMFLPHEYLNQEAISNLISVLQSRRANTLTDAINIYETQLHQKRIEEMEHQKLVAAQMSAQANQRAAIAQEETAKSMKKSAEAQERSAQAMKDVSLNMKNVQAAASNSAQKTSNNRKQMRCFHCKSLIDRKAYVCPHCGKPTSNNGSFSQLIHEKLLE